MHQAWFLGDGNRAISELRIFSMRCLVCAEEQKSSVGRPFPFPFVKQAFGMSYITMVKELHEVCRSIV